MNRFSFFWIDLIRLYRKGASYLKKKKIEQKVRILNFLARVYFQEFRGIQAYILNHMEDAMWVDIWVGATDVNSDGAFRWIGQYY